MLIRQRLAATGKRFYCVCFSIRSGSSLLCEDLAHWGLGEPTEYFHVADPALVNVNMADHLVALAQGVRSDYFGFKISWDQAFELTQRLRGDDDSVGFDLRTVFPDLSYIHNVRRDKLAQAISAWRASRSGIWHWPVGTQVEPGRPPYDFEAIKAFLQQALAEDWLWQSHYDEGVIQPLTVDYEDYARDRVGHLNRIVELLGANPATPQLEDRLQVMRDDWTERIATRFRADLYQVPDPILVRSIVVAPPNPDDRTTWADRGRPAVAARRRTLTSFRIFSPLCASVAAALSLAAVDAALPQVTLAPLLILAPLLAAFLVSPRGVALVAFLATVLMLPLGFADDISDTAGQLLIVAGILAAGAIAIWISQRLRRSAADPA